MYFINESRLLIIFLLSVSTLYHDVTELELTFCGFEQTCSRNNTDQETREDSCCRPCECDDICIEKGTCCRDKERSINTHDYEIQKCLTPIYKSKDITTPVLLNHVTFFTRARCPKDFEDTKVKEKCENDELDDVAVIRPVSSADGKVIYKNKYCSYCHGERERTIHGWDILIHRASPANCLKMLRRTPLHIDSIANSLIENCILVFVPPKIINFWKLVCFQETNVIQKCNETGYWKSFDGDIYNHCHNQSNQSEGYIAFDESGNLYRNLNCFICNGNSRKRCNKLSEKIPDIPIMFTLLNINTILEKDNTETINMRCNNSEILDTFFNSCRPLHCLWNSMPYKGKCLPFLAFPINTGYKINLKLIPNEYIVQDNLTEDDLIANYVLINKEFDFDKCKLCYMCTLFNKDGPENVLREMYVQITITISANCRIEKIWSLFMSAELKLPTLLKINVNKRLVPFKAFWGNDVRVSLVHFKKVLERGSVHNCKFIKPMRGEICPKINLQQHEIESVMKNHPRAEELVWVPNKEDINGSAFVCIHNYVSNQRSLTPRKNVTLKLVIFTVGISWSVLSR